MPAAPRALAAASLIAALCAFSSIAAAQTAGPAARLDPRLASGVEGGGEPAAAPAYRFEGLALYAAAGPGFVADLGEPSFHGNVYFTIPVARWALFEVASSLAHLGATTPGGGRDQTNGLGIGAGMRFAPFQAGGVRPYAAARLAHVHFWPDPWGERVVNADGTYDRASTHRWGAALGAGLDAPLLPASERLRIGLDLQAMALSGPSANVLLHAALTLGFGL